LNLKPVVQSILAPVVDSFVGIVVFCAIMTTVVSSLAWFIEKRRGKFHFIEVLSPSTSFLVWYGLGVVFPERGKSLANLIELPVIASISILLTYANALFISKHVKNHALSIIVIFIFNCISAFLVYFLVPCLQE
jgi:hypothetical protein